jgi:hypothetical protein
MKNLKSGRAPLTALAVAACVVLSACASQRGGSAPESATRPTEPGGRIVKSQDGTFDGEIVGTPTAGSKFAKLKIGMTMREVNAAIGAPDDLVRHETGKRWIPFYFGDDAQRMEALVMNEGCLTSPIPAAMSIEVDRTGKCLDR